MSEKGLVRSFIDSILTPEGRDTLVDWAELGLDNLLTNEALRELPLVKTVLGVAKGTLGLRDRFLVQKVGRFLISLGEVEEEEKQKFLQRLSESERYRTKVMDHLLLLIDRLDDADKANIIGELFKATIREEIAIDTFLKLSAIVETAYISDLQAFMSVPIDDLNYFGFLKSNAMTPEVMKQLASLGLLSERIAPNSLMFQMQHGGGQPPRYHFEYGCTGLGEQFARCCACLFNTTVN